MGMKLIDETGNRYGTLTVQSLTKDKNNRTAWLCKCDCGNEKIVRGPDLRKGRITSCGQNCPCKNYHFKDLTGQRFGRLIAIEPTQERKNNRIVWKCQCDCGNICYVSNINLQQEHTQSCGCLYQETHTGPKKDLTGKKFGLLTVLKNTNQQTKDSSFLWLCQCECGNTKIVDTHSLCSGNIQSCGCKTYSHGEIFIKNILEKHNIIFTPQKSFNNLLSNNNKKLRFDFEITYNNKKYYIEYNGQQHYQPIGYFGGEEKFLLQQENDNKKIQWCKDNNLPLLIIKYDDIEIEKIILDFIKNI